MRRLALAVLLAALFLVPRATAATSACAACRNPSFGVTPRSANGGGFPKALAAADFDGDGLLDLVTANESNDESPHGFAFLRGLPGGRFADPVYSFPVFNGSSIVAVDLDRDGRMDLVILGQEGLLVIFGNGDETFSEPQPYLTGQNFVSSFAVGDLNGDGLPDLAATDTSGLIVLLNRGDGTFGPPTVVLGPPADQIVLGDFTGDGLLDALVGGHVYPGMGNGTFSATPAPGQVLLSPGAIARDFNRDGKLDLASLALGNLAVAYGNGDGTFDPPVVLANVTPGTGNSIAAADFNGDGWLDLLVASFSDGIVLVRSDGTGGFLPALTYATAIPPVAVTAADIDSDGRPDAIVAYQDSVSFPITVYLSNPDGSLQQELRVPSAAAALASAELTGDGKRDLVIGGMGIAVWIGDGNGGFSAGYQNASPTNVVALAIQDVNHDGHLDIVAVTRGPDFFATDGFYWVFLGDGAGGFSPLPSVHLNFAPNSAALALLNADALRIF